MPPRALPWAVGVPLTLATSGLLALDAASREFAAPVALLGLALSALAAEGSAVVSTSKRADRSLPFDARPADGVVEVISMAGVEGVANPESPRFRRFERIVGHASPRRTPTADRPLLGRVALVSVFVGRDGVGWDDGEIARGHASLERAGAWIEREAIRHGAPANVAFADVYFRVQDDEVDAVEVAFAGEGDDVGPMEARAATKAVFAASRAAAGFGFADAADWIAAINGRLDADGHAWLFHVRRSGRSLAIPAGESDLDGVGLALCYAREASFPEPLEGPARVDPITAAHELLHLFGASDKYGVPLRSFPPGSVTSRDIMRLDRPRLSGMTIDRRTAAEVGWCLDRQARGSTKNARRRPRRVGGGREEGQSDRPSMDR